MNTLLVTVPFNGYKRSIPIGLGVLKRCLGKVGIITEILDLNTKTYQYLLKKSNIIKSIKQIKNTQEILQSRKLKNPQLSPVWAELYSERYKILESFDETSEKKISEILSYLDEILSIYDFESNFESEELIAKKSYLIDLLLYTATLNYYPFGYYMYLKPFFNEEIDALIFNNFEDFLFDSDNNIFQILLKKITEKMIFNKYDYIGITIPSKQALIPALTFASLIKQKTNAHISIGGPAVVYLKDFLKKNEFLFTKCIDSIMFGDSETSIIELMEYIAGKRKIKDVHNLIYLQNNKVNENKSFKNISDMISPEYNIEDNNCISSIIPLEFSRGCYWGKCSFCANTIIPYQSKKIQQLIDEINNCKRTFGTNKFFFTDNTLSPTFLDKFTSIVIKEKMNIFYYGNIRFEKQFTRELLQKIYDSGCRFLFAGLESGSQRMLDLMHKGIQLDICERILKDAYEIGLFVSLSVIIGYPGETKEDLDKTLQFVQKNQKYIYNVIPSPFFPAYGAEITSKISSLKTSKITNGYSNFSDVSSNTLKNTCKLLSKYSFYKHLEFDELLVISSLKTHS